VHDLVYFVGGDPWSYGCGSEVEDFTRHLEFFFLYGKTHENSGKSRRCTRQTVLIFSMSSAFNIRGLPSGRLVDFGVPVNLMRQKGSEDCYEAAVRLSGFYRLSHGPGAVYDPGSCVWGRGDTLVALGRLNCSLGTDYTFHLRIQFQATNLALNG
jgi:hypothetical protein